MADGGSTTKKKGSKPGPKKKKKPLDIDPSRPLDYKARKKANWPLIEQEYVAGIRTGSGTLHFPTLNELADRHDVKLTTIYKQSHRKKWVEKRQQYMKDLRDKTMEKKASEWSEEIIQFDRDMFHIAKAMKHIITEKVFVMTRDESGKVIRAKPNVDMNSMECRRWAEIANMIQSVRTNAVGEGNQNNEKTAVDDLVEQLSGLREEAGVTEAKNKKDELHPGDFVIEGVDDV